MTDLEKLVLLVAAGYVGYRIAQSRATASAPQTVTIARPAVIDDQGTGVVQVVDDPMVGYYPVPVGWGFNAARLGRGHGGHGHGGHGGHHGGHH